MDIRLIFLNHGLIVMSSGGTQKVKLAGDWKCRSKRVASLHRKIRANVDVRRDGAILRDRK